MFLIFSNFAEFSPILTLNEVLLYNNLVYCISNKLTILDKKNGYEGNASALNLNQIVNTFKDYQKVSNK